MKKILMTMVAALGLAISANAQVYVGGGFAVQGHDNGGNTYTTYKFLPEVGYNLNENWAVGTVFGWTGATKNGKKSFDINPYARFTPVHTKYINVFVVSAMNTDMVHLIPALILGQQVCVLV